MNLCVGQKLNYGSQAFGNGLNYMSNPRAKAERSKAKDIRQGIVEQRPVSTNSKKKYNYEVLCDFCFTNAAFNHKDYRLGKFHKLSDAEKCKEAAEKKKYYTNVRINPL